MSPEQAQAAPDLDARADLFSVGAMLFESLAGRPPHVGNTYEAVIVSICMNDAPDLKTLVPEASPQLARFVKRALARDRHARFSSARQMLVALAEFAPMERVSGDEGRSSARNQASGDMLRHTVQPATKPSPQASQGAEAPPRGTSTSWIAADRIPSVVSTPSQPRSTKTLVITGLVATLAGGFATTLLLAHDKHGVTTDPARSTSSANAIASTMPSVALSASAAPVSTGPRLVLTAVTPQPSATAAPSASAPKIKTPATSTTNQKHPTKKGDLDLDRDFP
jgi:serine/threonine-protein kinase